MPILTQHPRSVAALTEAVLTRTHRVPMLRSDLGDWPGDARTVTQQLDAVLATLGFTLSGELTAHLAGQDPVEVHTAAVHIIGTLRRMVGDHVAHNTYFIDFPNNVPPTRAFWERCLREALGDAKADLDGICFAKINLLELPAYGRYPHDYLAMTARHDELIATVKDRVTVLHLGGDLVSEVHALYASLVASPTPLSPADLALVADWAPFCPTPAELPPVRETRAVVNAGRLVSGYPMVVDTPTDMLRACCAASSGDPTLETPTRFRSFTRRERRQIMGTLDRLVRLQANKLGDIAQYREPWKRLGERLHPHEYTEDVHARFVFDVARGVVNVRSLTSRVQHAFDTSDRVAALQLLDQAPGMLLRNVDRLLRCLTLDDLLTPLVVSSIRQAAGAASGRVLLGLREHLANRQRTAPARVFGNRKGRAWVAPDTREPLDRSTVTRVLNILDSELHRRMPHLKHLVCDPACYGLALPLSGKNAAEGFGVLPRGSVDPIDGDRLRFFIYWRQAERRTDYDLSVLLLGDDFNRAGHLSYTELSGYGGNHSGDIVDAPNGASEFVDLRLGEMTGIRYIVPQVNVYAGEGFDEVAESMFGYMTRDGAAAGQPFEPRTVRARSELRGNGQVALPLAFARVGKSQWRAHWMHLYLRGEPFFNQVEGNHRSTSTLVAGVVGRERMSLGHYLTMMGSEAEQIYQYTPGGKVLDSFGRPAELPSEPVTYVGIEDPGGLPAGSDVYTLNRLHELVVA